MDKSGQSGEKHSFHKENSSLMNMLCFYEDLKKKKKCIKKIQWTSFSCFFYKPLISFHFKKTVNSKVHKC